VNNDLHEYKPPSEAQEAEAAVEWVELVRHIAPRLGRRLQVDLGPISGGTLKGLREVGPLPPRERGHARMERGLRHVFRAVSEDKSYRFIRCMIISSMCKRLDDIADLVGECVEDDEKAGLLMETIGYAIDDMADFERGEGAAAPRRELASYEALHATHKGGGDARGAHLAADSDRRWRREGGKIWRERYADLAPDDPNRVTVEDLAILIQDDIAGVIKFGTIVKQIGKWNKREGIEPNKKRRSSFTSRKVAK
jgi:hypothetical protein